MNTEIYVFFIFILLGFLIGIFFDFFRILRRSFKTKDIITYIEDVLFWIITGFAILYTTFKFNNGEIRGYIFLGMFIGFTIYILIFSKTFIKINVTIIIFLKKVIYFSIIKPIFLIVSFLKKIIKKPIFFVFVNISKIVSKIKAKRLFLHKNHKNQGN